MDTLSPSLSQTPHHSPVTIQTLRLRCTVHRTQGFKKRRGWLNKLAFKILCYAYLAKYMLCKEDRKEEGKKEGGGLQKKGNSPLL